MSEDTQKFSSHQSAAPEHFGYVSLSIKPVKIIMKKRNIRFADIIMLLCPAVICYHPAS